jgi:hypothetical protein
MVTKWAARIAAVASCVFLVEACASTALVSIWAAPELTRLTPPGRKVVALAFMTDQSVRRPAEDALASQLTALGTETVAAYTLISDEPHASAEAAKAALDAAGVGTVVAVRPVASPADVVVTPAYHVEPHFRTLWNGGYWQYGWANAWTVATDAGDADAPVYVETLAYSTADDALVWSGRSRRRSPSSVANFVDEVIEAATRQMKKAGLL